MKETINQQSFFLRLLVFGGIVFIFLMLFALARSIYRDNFQVGSYLSSIETEIEKQKNAVAESDRDADYVRTPQYQEKIAKEMLGLKLPDEEVMIFTEDTQDLEDLLPLSLREKKAREKYETVPEKWRRYIFNF